MWGDKASWFEALAAEGKETEALKSRPSIPRWLWFEWSAYADLRSERAVGLDVGPIPWASIYRYAAVHGVSHIDDIEQFMALIRAMESAEIEHDLQSRNRSDQRV